MKMKLNDVGGIIAVELMDPITRRLEGIFARTELKEVVVNIERRVMSGKAGVIVGPLKDNVSLPFSVQCGKGGHKFRGNISAPSHVAQVLAELEKVSDPSLKVFTGSKRGVKKKQRAGKLSKTASPKLDKKKTVSSDSLRLSDDATLREVIMVLAELKPPMLSSDMTATVVKGLRLTCPSQHIAFMFHFLDKRNLITKDPKVPKSYWLTQKAMDLWKSGSEESSVPASAKPQLLQVSATQTGLQKKIVELEADEGEFGRLIGEINTITAQVSELKNRVDGYEVKINGLQTSLSLLARLRKELGVKSPQTDD